VEQRSYSATGRLSGQLRKTRSKPSAENPCSPDSIRHAENHAFRSTVNRLPLHNRSCNFHSSCLFRSGGEWTVGSSLELIDFSVDTSFAEKDQIRSLDVLMEIRRFKLAAPAVSDRSRPAINLCKSDAIPAGCVESRRGKSLNNRLQSHHAPIGLSHIMHQLASDIRLHGSHILRRNEPKMGFARRTVRGHAD
jgi:hypothetical protein